jgi:hypothetical protein
MKTLQLHEANAVSGGIRSTQIHFGDRSRLGMEPADPISRSASLQQSVGLARSMFAEAAAFATPISIAGFVAPAWMTGGPIRSVPIIDETPAFAVVAAAEDGPANAADSSIGQSSAESNGGGGDSGASGCSSGDGGGCGGW